MAIGFIRYDPIEGTASKGPDAAGREPAGCFIRYDPIEGTARTIKEVIASPVMSVSLGTTRLRVLQAFNTACACCLFIIVSLGTTRLRVLQVLR